MGLAIAFGVIGYIARKTGYHVAAIFIGVILGPLLEQYFLRALKKIRRRSVDIVFLDSRQRTVAGPGPVPHRAAAGEVLTQARRF